MGYESHEIQTCNSFRGIGRCMLFFEELSYKKSNPISQVATRWGDANLQVQCHQNYKIDYSLLKGAHSPWLLPIFRDVTIHSLL